MRTAHERRDRLLSHPANPCTASTTPTTASTWHSLRNSSRVYPTVPTHALFAWRDRARLFAMRPNIFRNTGSLQATGSCLIPLRASLLGCTAVPQGRDWYSSRVPWPTHEHHPFLRQWPSRCYYPSSYSTLSNCHYAASCSHRPRHSSPRKRSEQRAR